MRRFLFGASSPLDLTCPDLLSVRDDDGGCLSIASARLMLGLRACRVHTHSAIDSSFARINRRARRERECPTFSLFQSAYV